MNELSEKPSKKDQGKIQVRFADRGFFREFKIEIYLDMQVRREAAEQTACAALDAWLERAINRDGDKPLMGHLMVTRRNVVMGRRNENVTLKEGILILEYKGIYPSGQDRGAKEDAQGLELVREFVVLMAETFRQVIGGSTRLGNHVWDIVVNGADENVNFQTTETVKNDG